MPNPANIHIDAPLSQFALAYKQTGFVGYDVSPVVRVAKESDYYYIFGSSYEHTTPGNFVRADGAPANEIRFSVSNTTYTCEEYSARYFLSDRKQRNADPQVRLDMIGTQLLKQKLDLAKEVRLQDLLQGTGGSISGATPGTKWDVTGADIEGDINTARQTIMKATGVQPNFMLMSREVHDALYVAIKDFHNSNLTVADRLSFGSLPPNLWGLRVIVADAIKNASNPGQTASNGFLWNDTVVLGYIEPSPSLETMSLIYTFQVQAPSVIRYRDEERRGEYIELSLLETEKVVCASAGYRITDVLT